jgi:predicted phosphodiesterase
MRIAALYDVHGNLPALEAVLDDVRHEGVDQIVVGGDVVPGPMPRESIAALLALPLPVRFIHGNGERDLLALHHGEDVARAPQRFRDALRWTAGELPPEHLSALASWPLTARMNVPGLGDVVFCHATPRDDNEIFTRLTPARRLRPIFEATDAALVVCGHTHMQFDRKIGNVRVVNAGSVGMPFGEPGAYWALVGAEVELRRTDYDLAAAAARITATDYPRVSEFDVSHLPTEAHMLEILEAAAIDERPTRERR